MKFIKFSTLVLTLLGCAFIISCACPNYADDAGRGPNSDKPESTADFQVFPKSQLGTKLYWDHYPQSEKDYGVFTVEVFDPADRSHFLDPQGTLTAQLWMPDMGHGSTPITVEKVDTGVYRFSKVLFIMRGDWQIKLQIKNGAELIDELIYEERF